MKRDRFLNPENHVIAGAPFIIAQIVIEAEFVDQAGLKQGNHFIRPASADPSFSRLKSNRSPMKLKRSAIPSPVSGRCSRSTPPQRYKAVCPNFTPETWVA